MSKQTLVERIERLAIVMGPIATAECDQMYREILADVQEIERSRDALNELARYFTSGNGVSVERATIYAKDFYRIAVLQKTGADKS